MVALPTSLLSPTIAAIDAAVGVDRHKLRISASMLENECDRSIWYDFRWVPDPAPRKAKAARSGDIAMAIKPLIGRWLGQVGIAIDTVNMATGEAHSASTLDGHFYSPLDAFCTGIIEAPKKRHLLFLAALNSGSFKQVQKTGVAVARPEHLKRAQVLMHLSGVDRTAYAYANRDDGQIGLERIHYDAAHALALMAKAERVFQAARPLPRITDDPASFLCRFCPSHSVCHSGTFALRNCRTCLHSTPVMGGNARWICERHGRDLSIDDQAAGCASHLFIPDLVPGEQTDCAPDQSSVTYRLPDGTDWIDGRAATPLTPVVAS